MAVLERQLSRGRMFSNNKKLLKFYSCKHLNKVKSVRCARIFDQRSCLMLTKADFFLLKSFSTTRGGILDTWGLEFFNGFYEIIKIVSEPHWYENKYSAKYSQQRHCLIKIRICDTILNYSVCIPSQILFSFIYSHKNCMIF